MGYKIINFNDAYTPFKKNLKINLICYLDNSKCINNYIIFFILIIYNL